MATFCRSVSGKTSEFRWKVVKPLAAASSMLPRWLFIVDYVCFCISVCSVFKISDFCFSQISDCSTRSSLCRVTKRVLCLADTSTRAYNTPATQDGAEICLKGATINTFVGRDHQNGGVLREFNTEKMAKKCHFDGAKWPLSDLQQKLKVEAVVGVRLFQPDKVATSSWGKIDREHDLFFSQKTSKNDFRTCIFN